MRIAVDRDRCTGLGICESLAPKYFEVNDAGELDLLQEPVDAEDLSDVEAAVSSCPTEALRLSAS